MAAALEVAGGAQRHRYRLAYAVLAVVFWVSVGGFVVLLYDIGPAHSHPWSAWKPDTSTDTLVGAHEIAQHVGAEYVLPSGRPVAGIQEHPPNFDGVPLEVIGLRHIIPGATIDPYVYLFGANETIIYSLCGLQSTSCVLPLSATTVRPDVLRREALELALYSFKYLKNVDQIVELYIRGGTTTEHAVLVRKADVTKQLHRSLRSTLPLARVTTSQPDPRETPNVDLLTSTTLPAHVEQLPDGDAILVLSDSATN